uniref:Uncharacterized protein n=1 Tax=Anguilla anguilla TaxID=7936 RepID=A0A0E9R2S0_ANGAN
MCNICSLACCFIRRDSHLSVRYLLSNAMEA